MSRRIVWGLFFGGLALGLASGWLNDLGGHAGLSLACGLLSGCLLTATGLCALSLEMAS